MSDISAVGDASMASLYQAMQGLSARQQAIAQNVANIETPGYTAKQVKFEDSLRSATAAGTPNGASITVAPTTDPARADGNNVNLDDQTLLGQKTNLQFQTMVAAMNAKFQLLNTAISGSAGGG